MKKRMKNKMSTLHTYIRRGEVEYNSPSYYEIKNKETDGVIQPIKIQKGAVKDCGLNGIFIEDLILICIDQLEHFQNSEFACEENEDTLRHLRDALYSTRSRQYSRSLRGVQGRNRK